MADILPFNPLDKKNLGASVAEALLAAKVHPMSAVPGFYGAGVYVIYYAGDFDPYAELSRRNMIGNAVAPIYIGKAVPAGARKGLNTATGSRALYSRLTEHVESIRSANNLRLEDFYCRYLVVDDIWIPLGESLLIARYAPVWNSVVDGFGNHDPGAGRYQGYCPRWDVLHPGRAWAAKCKPRNETQDQIARDVISYLSIAPYPTSDRFIGPDDK